jgi:REP element-mobilizing transposase RayT
MTRPLRIELANGLYHVTSRGDRCEPIFADGIDRSRLLEVVAQAMSRFDATAHAYCLMGNHYHFVLQTRQANLSRLMRHINGVYSQAYNRRHGITGHLFQGRFKAIHVDRDAYFMAVCRYVDLNPVRAGIAGDASAWPWSSYRAHAGIGARPVWLESDALHGQLLGRQLETADDHSAACSSYRAFVQAGRDDALWERGLRQEIYLGEPDFIERVQARMSAEQASAKDIPAAQTRRPRLARRSSTQSLREQQMLRAHVEDGLTLSAIAESWGLSVSRVSRLIRRAEQAASGEIRERVAGATPDSSAA